MCKSDYWGFNDAIHKTRTIRLSKIRHLHTNKTNKQSGTHTQDKDRKIKAKKQASNQSMTVTSTHTCKRTCASELTNNWINQFRYYIGKTEQNDLNATIEPTNKPTHTDANPTMTCFHFQFFWRRLFVVVVAFLATARRFNSDFASNYWTRRKVDENQNN